MDNLPDELLSVILLQVPTKSILCLSSACKSWRSRILNPNFVALHAMNTMANPDNHSLITLSKIYRRSFEVELCFKLINLSFLDRAINLYLPSILPSSYYYRAINLYLPSILPSSYYYTRDDYDNVVGSCKGVLCLAYNRKIHGVLIYLWNPATGQVKGISNYTIFFDRHLDEFYNVSFGFSFDVPSNDYKVVRIVTDKRRFISRVEVYSLRENSWKEIEVDQLNFNVLESVCPAVVKGLFYWFIELFHQPFKALVSFDVQKEKFCRIPLPDSYTCYDIFECEGSVALAEKLGGGFSIRILDDDSCWIEKFTITPPSQMEHIIGCLKTGEFVGQAITDSALIFYDSVSKVHTQLKLSALRVHYYSESLVNLNYPDGYFPKES